jgi:peptide deformylase
VLVKGTDPALKTPVPEFDFENPPVHPVELANLLCEFLKENKALGLAANQVGLPYRVFVTANDMVFFNPKIADDASEDILLEEGCLSFPNMFVKIKRPRRIKLRATNQFGQTDTVKFDGITARVVQQYIEILEGKMWNNVSKLQFDISKRKSKKHYRRLQS